MVHFYCCTNCCAVQNYIWNLAWNCFIQKFFLSLNDLWLTLCSFWVVGSLVQPWHLSFISSPSEWIICQSQAHWGHLNTKSCVFSVCFFFIVHLPKYLTLLPYTVIESCQIKIWKVYFYIWALTFYISAFQCVSFLHGFISVALLLLLLFSRIMGCCGVFLNIEKGMFFQARHRRVQHGSQCHSPLSQHRCCCFNKTMNKLIDY